LELIYYYHYHFTRPETETTRADVPSNFEGNQRLSGNFSRKMRADIPLVDNPRFGAACLEMRRIAQ
jgi:hypothetical protein